MRLPPSSAKLPPGRMAPGTAAAVARWDRPFHRPGQRGKRALRCLGHSTWKRRAHVEPDAERGRRAMLRRLSLGRCEGGWSCPVRPEQTTWLLGVTGGSSAWRSQGTQGTAPRFGGLVGRKEVPRDESSLPASSVFLRSWWGCSQVGLV